MVSSILPTGVEGASGVDCLGYYSAILMIPGGGTEKPKLEDLYSYNLLEILN